MDTAKRAATTDKMHPNIVVKNLPSSSLLFGPISPTSLLLSNRLEKNDGRTGRLHPNFFPCSSLLLFAFFSNTAADKLTNHGGGIDGGEARREADEGQQGQKEQAGHHLAKTVCRENERVRQLCQLSRGKYIRGLLGYES